MPRDVITGIYSKPSTATATAGQKILAARHNTLVNDLEAVLSEVVYRDGKQAMLGPLKLSDNATDPLHAVPKQQLDSGLATKVDASTLASYATLASPNTFTATQNIRTTGQSSIVMTGSYASPANGNVLSAIRTMGKNSSNALVDYGQIYVAITDATAGSEDGTINIQATKNGVLTYVGSFGQGLFLNGATGGDKGTGTANVTALYVNGASVFPASSAFTPALAFGGASVGITYSSRTGTVQQVGPNTAFVVVDITLTNKGSSAGAAAITGLPLTALRDSVSPTYFTGMSASAPNIGIAYGSVVTIYRGDGASTAMVPCNETNFTNTSRILWSGMVMI